MRQRPLTGRRRCMIALDHFRSFAALLLQLERRREEVDVEPGRRIEADHNACRFDALKAAVAHQAAHDRTVLLRDECLVILLVGTRARHLELLFATPWDNDVVHERAVVVEVHAAQKPGKQALYVFHRLDNERAIARHQWQALGPAGGDIDHRQRLDERTRNRRAATCDHVDLAGWDSLMLPEGAHRMFAVPARRRAQLIEDATLPRPLARPVALRHRRHHLAPRAHADPSRHRRHRSDSVTPAKSLAGTCPVTFLGRQCGGRAGGAWGCASARAGGAGGGVWGSTLTAA